MAPSRQQHPQGQPSVSPFQHGMHPHAQHGADPRSYDEAKGETFRAVPGLNEEYVRFDYNSQQFVPALSTSHSGSTAGLLNEVGLRGAASAIEQPVFPASWIPPQSRTDGAAADMTGETGLT